jgi:chromosomal replication initiator protein
MEFSRRGFIGFLTALTGSVIAGAKIPEPAAAATPSPVPAPPAPTAVPSPLVGPGAKLREALRARLGEDIYLSWFQTLELEGFDGETVTVSLPVKFLRNWIKSHYADDLLACCRAEFAGAQHVNLVLRQPGSSRSLLDAM